MFFKLVKDVAFVYASCFFVFGCAIVVFTLGVMFVTWSVPEFNDIEGILFTVRVLLAVSAFIGFCWTVAPDWEDEW